MRSNVFTANDFVLVPLAACVIAVLATSSAAAAAHQTGRYCSELAACTPSFVGDVGSGITGPTKWLRTPRPVRIASVPPRSSPSLVVGNCLDDDSAGSLRSVVKAAVNGDSIDLSALTCSTITLTQGAITTSLTYLELFGPTSGALTIDGSNAGRVIDHDGDGTLLIDHLRIVNGKNDLPEAGTNVIVGGCIVSSGNVALINSTVSNCTAGSEFRFLRGFGAGVFAYGNILLAQSSISGSDNVGEGRGGGAMALYGDMRLIGSTVSGNSASRGGGLVCYYGDLTLVNTTISGNSASRGGGVLAFQSLSIHNSTIAFNAADQGGGGIVVVSSPEIVSSIVANNITRGKFAADVSSLGTAEISVAGSDNLIGESDVLVPGDTLRGDPGLLPLADNGGSTLTHALVTRSAALDVGSNIDSLISDQRGVGFPRVHGVEADIGAYEALPLLDVIFQDGLDGS